MVEVVYVHETIHYDKLKKIGWSYKELTKRVDFKTKETRFYTYKGYCQFDNRDWDEDTFIEDILITGTYSSFPVDKKGSRLECDVRNVEYVWHEGYRFTELKKEDE